VAANRAQILIVGMPGRMQECLLTLLKAVPDLEVLGTGQEYSSLTDWDAETPDLVLLDCGQSALALTGEVGSIKAKWPSASCLVVADTARQLQVAKAAGADGVLLRGFAVGELFATLRELLQAKIRLSPELALADNAGSASHGTWVEGYTLLASPVVF
jgi:DNA-binding NarL/FixJ family response regulator